MDCIQSHHDPTFTTHESGFILDTRLFVVYYLPKSDRGSGASIISASGNWERQWDILSSGDIPMGIWKLEASDADESGTRLPNCPHVNTKFDCILDGGQYEDCKTIKCEDPNSYIPNPRGTVMKGYSEKSMIIFLPVEKFL